MEEKEERRGLLSGTIMAPMARSWRQRRGVNTRNNITRGFSLLRSITVGVQYVEKTSRNQVPARRLCYCLGGREYKMCAVSVSRQSIVQA